VDLAWVREKNEGNTTPFLVSFSHSCIFGELGEERLEESLEE